MKQLKWPSTSRNRTLTRKHWVFDLDGTLTLPVHNFNEICAELAVPEGVDILHHLATLPDEQSQPLRERLDVIERRLVARTGPAPGAQPLVALLAGTGCRLGILTRNTRDIALLTLEHIGLKEFFRPRQYPRTD